MSRIGSQAAAAPLRLRCNLRTQDPGMWMGWDGDGIWEGGCRNEHLTCVACF